MQKHKTACVAVLAAAISSGCPVSKKDYLDAYTTRLAAEARTRETEQRRDAVRARIDSLRATPQYRMKVRLEQQVAGLKAEIEQTKVALNDCRQNRLAETRPKPWVRVIETRVWDPQRQGMRAAAQALVEQRLSALEHCYRLHGWSSKGDHPLKGAVWVVFGIAEGGTRVPRISVSTLGQKQDSAPGQRAARLQQCVVDAFTTLRPQDQRPTREWMQFGPLIRIAQLLVFADNSTSASTIGRPPFDWPWPRRWEGGPAKQKEVCYPRDNPGDLTPRFSRPCARGLKCCYPCGIQGCASICLPSCPTNIP